MARFAQPSAACAGAGERDERSRVSRGDALGVGVVVGRFKTACGFWEAARGATELALRPLRRLREDLPRAALFQLRRRSDQPRTRLRPDECFCRSHFGYTVGASFNRARSDPQAADCDRVRGKRRNDDVFVKPRPAERKNCLLRPAQECVFRQGALAPPGRDLLCR